MEKSNKNPPVSAPVSGPQKIQKLSQAIEENNLKAFDQLLSDLNLSNEEVSELLEMITDIQLLRSVIQKTSTAIKPIWVVFVLIKLEADEMLFQLCNTGHIYDREVGKPEPKDFETKDKKGMTALHIAANYYTSHSKKMTAIIQLLLEKGATCNLWMLDGTELLPIQHSMLVSGLFELLWPYMQLCKDEGTIKKYRSNVLTVATCQGEKNTILAVINRFFR